jgi:hypothetical protein
MALVPALIVNPASDRVFADFAETIVAHGVGSPGDLEERLRSVYPLATVHVRELAAEAGVVWYVYRDGRWVDGRDPATLEVREIDVRHP